MCHTIYVNEISSPKTGALHIVQFYFIRGLEL